jgi:glycosyltransferase involved in cell wall biosynthesis
MFCSTVIPTIARPSLSRAVKSVLNQEFSAADFEVIVVNDSGRPLPTASWQHSERVRVIHTRSRDRSVARNTGSATARGDFLHFLDDDDWLLPGALGSFWKLARSGEAPFLYGNPLLTDRRGIPLVELDYDLGGNCFIQLIAGEFFFLGSFVVDASTFFAVGGFNPRLPASEELDLCRRIALHGPFVGTSNVVVCVAVGEEDSTTDYEQLVAYNRRAREGILDEPNAFARMRDSAHNTYWWGRIVRTYATSVIWNLQNRRPLTAINRASFALGSLALAGRHLLATDFWRAIAKSHWCLAYSRGNWNPKHPKQLIDENNL